MTAHVRTDDRDALSIAQRVPELVVALAMLGLLAFFLYHQQTESGFFTEKFGTVEMFWLYGPIIAGIIAPLMRALTGNRNPARPFEILTSLFLAVGSFWLLTVFPFDFSRLNATLPTGLQFALAWITDGVGKVLLLLQVIIGPISALLVGAKYLAARHRLSTAY